MSPSSQRQKSEVSRASEIEKLSSHEQRKDEPESDPDPPEEQPISIARNTIVTWDGPADPKNPQNWPTSKKLATVLLVSVIGFQIPFCSSVSAPATPSIMAEFNSSSDVLASFIISVYVLGTAVGPVLFAPASEIWGRSIVFHASNVLFLAFTIACALSTSLAMLMVFRFLAGCVGAAPLSVGGGTIADIIPAKERGKYVAIFAIGGTIGPIIGPVVGGFLSEAAGWRWTFWLVVIIGGVVTSLSFLLVRETHAPTLLKRKAALLRKQTGNPSFIAEGDRMEKRGTVFLRAFTRPAKVLIQSPIALSLAIYQSLLWGYLYLMFTTFPQVFGTQYHFNAGLAGLAYLGLGIGNVAAMGFSAKVSDRLMLSYSRKRDSEPKPEARLILMGCGAPLIPIGLFWYGWAAEYRDHWIVPMLGTVVLGAGMLLTALSGNLYMIDAFAEYAASALAGSFFLRSIFGGLLPLAGQPLFNALGVGWGSSVLAFISLAMCIMPPVLLRYGDALTKRFPINL